MLPDLVMGLKVPLGLAGTETISGPQPRKAALRFCLGLGLTQQDGTVQFRAVLDALITANYKSKNSVLQVLPPICNVTFLQKPQRRVTSLAPLVM